MSDLNEAARQALNALEIIAEEKIDVLHPITDKQRAAAAAAQLRHALNQHTLSEAVLMALDLLEGETEYTRPGVPLSMADDARHQVILALRTAIAKTEGRA